MKKLLVVTISGVFLLIWAWYVRDLYAVSVLFLMQFALFGYAAVISKGTVRGIWTAVATVALSFSLFEFALFLADQKSETGPITGTYAGSS